MVNNSIISNTRNQIAFEEIVKQEALKYVTRSKTKKVLDSVTKYGLIVAVPNIVAGTAGFISGGIEGAYNAMEQVSLSVVPYSLIFAGVLDYFTRFKKSDNINNSIKNMRVVAATSIKSVENNLSMVNPSSKIIFGASVYCGLSLLTEKIFGVDFNQIQMAMTGAGVGLIDSAILSHMGNKLKNKILTYAAENVEDIKKYDGVELELDDLEGLVRGALKNPEKTHKIYVASSNKNYRGASGALGFLGALDALADKSRDPTRIKPNVTLDLKSDSFRNSQKYPQFILNYDRTKSKTETILDIVRLVSIQSKDLKLNISSFFNSVPLATISKSPYEQLSGVNIYAKKDDAKYFELKYTFNQSSDNIELIVNSNKCFGLVSNLFKELYGRSIKDTDFDSELVQLSDKTKSPLVDNSAFIKEFKEDIDELIKKGIDYTSYLPKSEDPILNLLPKKDFDYGFNNKNESVSEKPEQPTLDFSSLSKKVIDIYKSNTSNIQKSDAFSALGIAFDGLVYYISPVEFYSEKGRKKHINHKILHTIFSPFSSVKSLIKEDGLLPDIREIELITQISGINKDNICDIIQVMESSVDKLYVRPSIHSMSYSDFFDASSNYNLLFNKSSYVDLTDGTGTKITINLTPTKDSYDSIRKEYFLTGNDLINKAEEVKKQKEADTTFEGLLSRCVKSRYEKELTHKTYDVVASSDNVPSHIVIYNSNDIVPFKHNSSIRISTKDKIFTEMPVYLKEGVTRVTNYLSLIKDSIDKVVFK